MKMNKWMVLSGALVASASCQMARAADATMTIDMSKSGAKISPLLYGIFYEEINRAGDGGLYAEMLENRSFEDSATVSAWNTNGKAVLSLDKSRPLNSVNPTALKVAVGTAGGGAISAGFKGVGLFVQSGQSYLASFYARSGANYGPLEVHLENRNGTVLSRGKVERIGTEWQKYTVKLAPSVNDPEARLVIQGAEPGTFFLDQVSLMPAKIWKNTPLRPDLAERVADMKPAFVRFPGGCFVEGDKMANAVKWKETIGDVAMRPGRQNLWGYRSTDGFGLHEFFQWCEDMGSEPLYVINCGMAHADHVPLDQIGSYVQDALDLIEYANGPATSKWGAMRAKNGHPAPFNLKYMEIGNENGGKLYDERYTLFYDAIKAKYPKMNLVANDWWQGKPTSRPIEIIDEHYYDTPAFFRSRANMYDSYSRSGPKVYVGEYAVTKECGKGNLDAALGEAAYMTGLERNADIVSMASYAPLLVNPQWERWNPNAIVFDQSRSYGTPSYWVQSMFGKNRGDVVVPLQIDAPVAATDREGGIGVGTWLTQAEFKDIRVERDGKTLYQSNFAGPDATKNWRLLSGNWSVADGALRQTSDVENAQAHIGDKSWGSDYTLHLKARKISGNEGFLISFRLPNDDSRRWWNLGGWGNTSHALESVGNVPKVNGSIETGRWYDIRVEAKGADVKCYLDGALVQSGSQPALSTMFGVASRTADGKDLILKVVNTASQPMPVDINLQGVKKLAPTAEASVLSSGSVLDENTFERPNNIVPKSAKVAVKAGGFVHTFPANSVTVVRLKTG
jgi:alpha-L-arabinofuranosidase